MSQVHRALPHVTFITSKSVKGQKCILEHLFSEICQKQDIQSRQNRACEQLECQSFQYGFLSVKVSKLKQNRFRKGWPIQLVNLIALFTALLNIQSFCKNEYAFKSILGNERPTDRSPDTLNSQARLILYLLPLRLLLSCFQQSSRMF